MKKFFNDIDNWLSAKGAWWIVSALILAVIGLLFDHFFADHALYPEFLKDWSPYAKGWSIIIIIASPVFIYFLFVEIFKSWKNRDKY